MKFRPFIITFLLASSFLTSSALTIPEVLHTIATDNPILQSAKAANLAEELTLRSENTLPPTSVEYSPFFRPGVGGVASSELIVSQDFDFPTLYSNRAHQASLERQALDAATSVARRDLLLEAQERLLDLILCNKNVEILRTRLSDTEGLLKAYERALELGSATLLEVNKVRLARKELQREIMENEAEAESCVKAVIGLNGNRRIDLTGLVYTMGVEELPFPDDPNVLLSHDAGFRAATADLKAAEYGVKLAKSGWLPGFTVGYRRNTEEHQASNGFMVGASLPLFSNSAKMRAANARLASSRLKLETLMSQSSAELLAVADRFIRQRKIFASYDLKLIMETISLYRKGLIAGQIPLTTYYTEVDALYDTLLTRARIENEVHRSYAQLTSSLL